MDNDNHNVNTNTGKKSFVLIDFDEPSDVQAQEHCQLEIDDVLTALQGLVRVTELPEDTKLYLLDGLRHIGCHVHMQTMLLTADISGRVN